MGQMASGCCADDAVAQRELPATAGAARGEGAAGGLEFQALREATPIRAPAVHVKGFGSGLALDGPVERAAVAELRAAVDRMRAETIVFDGDPLNAGGFTAVLAELAGGSRDLVAFALDVPGKTESMRAAWEGRTARGMRVVLVPEEAAGVEESEVAGIVGATEEVQMYAGLGRAALRFTGATQAVVLGGGITVEVEVQLNPDVAFRVWPLSRTLKDGTVQACQIARGHPNTSFEPLAGNTA